MGHIANQVIDKLALGDRQGSLASLPLPKHMSNEEAARRRAVSEAGPRPNMTEYLKTHKPESTTTTLANDSNVSSTTDPTSVSNTETAVAETQLQTKEKTDCECSKSAQHFPTVVMDNKYDTTIETMYNILFNSSFMNKFLCEVEKSQGKGGNEALSI